MKQTIARATFMTRRFAFRALSASVIAATLAAPAWAATFGKVVPIGGNASDIVLDESRHSLYIANFTANRIEVMNTSDRSIGTSMNVPLPGSLAMSRDGKYLVVGTYANFQTPNGQTSKTSGSAGVCMVDCTTLCIGIIAPARTNCGRFSKAPEIRTGCPPIARAAGMHDQLIGVPARAGTPGGGQTTTQRLEA